MSSDVYDATFASCATTAVSCAVRAGSVHAFCVIGPSVIVSASSSLVYVPLKSLHPVEPLTLSSVKARDAGQS